METKLLCALVAVVVSLNVQVTQNKFLLGICKQSKLLILVSFACFKSHDFFGVGFFVVSYSHKAARHVRFCVFIRLAKGDMICRTSNPPDKKDYRLASLDSTSFIMSTFSSCLKCLHKENLMEQRKFFWVHLPIFFFSPWRKTFVKLPPTPLQL